MQQHFRIAGSARYLPAHSISSVELDSRLRLPTGSTFRSTGVQTRYSATGEDTAASMARRVIHEALNQANRGIHDIDWIIDASLCVQQPLPCNGALIQAALGADAAGIPCMDVHASCLGFVAALPVVNGLFASGAASRVVVVCSETPLKGVNWDEPESACLMGDAAAAFVFEASNPCGLFCMAMETFSEGVHLGQVEGGGHLMPPSDYTHEQRARYLFHMEGREVHKLASRLLPPLVKRVLTSADCSLSELEVVPHQASGPSVELIARRLGIPRDHLHSSVAEHGNLVSASIPYVLHGLRQRRERETKVMLLGTAAGYSQAVCIFSL